MKHCIELSSVHGVLDCPKKTHASILLYILMHVVTHIAATTILKSLCKYVNLFVAHTGIRFQWTGRGSKYSSIMSGIDMEYQTTQ